MLNSGSISFTPAMVRAILDGRKTQTRRLVKQSPGDVPVHNPREGSPWPSVGRRLWVRENLTFVSRDPVRGGACALHCYTADVPEGMSSANPYTCTYLFPEDGEPNLPRHNVIARRMPRWASRLTLEVTSVRVERLMEITEADAMAEGALRFDSPTTFVNELGVQSLYLPEMGYARAAFARLFDSINGAGSWARNPMVWVIEFRRVPG